MRTAGAPLPSACGSESGASALGGALAPIASVSGPRHWGQHSLVGYVEGWLIYAALLVVGIAIVLFIQRR